jgi:hypothetical protein
MTKKDVLKAVHTHCIECLGGHVQEVPKCTAPRCKLFPFRMGYDPNPCHTKGRHLIRDFRAPKAFVEEVS